MSAIGGVIDFGSGANCPAACNLIISAQNAYANQSPALFEGRGVSIGIALHSVSGALPRGRYGSDLLFVADVRLDNRDELLARLGRAEFKTLNDPDLLAEAWRRWKLGCLQFVVGDFALAAFDCLRRRLVLARDVTGQRPLHYASLARGFAFASMPSGLLTVPGIDSSMDRQALVASALDLPREPGGSLLSKIHTVRPGHVVIATADKLHCERYWTPLLRTDAASSFDDDVEEYRALLDRAVASRLPSPGKIATHLSSGWDSNAVTSTATRIAGQRDILALTAAPQPGNWPVPRGRVADESETAAKAAAFYRIDHRVIRSTVRMSDQIRRQVRFKQDPGGNLVNGGWLAAIDEQARVSGATVILSGELGNHGLNMGGLSALAAIRSRHGFIPWLKEATINARRPEVRWTGILYNSFGRQLPRSVRDLLRRGFHDQHRPERFGFVRRDAIESFPAIAMPDGWDELDATKARLSAFEGVDPGLWRKGALAEHGVETRDPTADRRVIEFALRLEPERLLSAGVDRPLARAALSDRVFPPVLDSRLRGAQSADWPAMIDVAGLHDLCEEVSANDTVRWLIDADAVHTALRDLQPSDAFRFSDYDRYASYLPAVLATALFVHETERSALR